MVFITYLLEKERNFLHDHDRIVIFFYSKRCPFCNKIMPYFLKYAKEFNTIVFCMIEIEASELFYKYDVEFTPTILFFVAKKEINRFIGTNEKELLISIINLSTYKIYEVLYIVYPIELSVIINTYIASKNEVKRYTDIIHHHLIR